MRLDKSHRLLGILGGGSTTFSPASVSGMQMHLDASQIQGINESDPIDDWEGAGTSSVNATSSGSDRPTYVTNQYGKPGVAFTGGQHMDITGSPYFFEGSTGSIFIVHDQSVFSGRQNIIGSNGTTGAFGIEVDDKGINTAIAGAFVVKTDELPEAALNEPRITACTRSGTGTGTTGIYGNSLPLKQDTDDNENFTATASFEIGRRDVGSQEYEGRIYEIIVYDREVTDTERRNITTYLANKWQGHLRLIPWIEWIAEDSVPANDEWAQGCVRLPNGNMLTVTATVNRSVQLEEWDASDPENWIKVGVTKDITSDLPFPGDPNGQFNSATFRDGILYLGGTNAPNESPHRGWISRFSIPTLATISHIDTVNCNSAAHCEGGDWKLVNGQWRFFAIFHDSLDVDVFDEDLTYIETVSRPSNGRTDYDNISQGARWLDDILFTPNHNTEGSYTVEWHPWDGSSFGTGGRIQVLVNATSPKSFVGQGPAFYLLPGVTPKWGDTIIIPRRRSGANPDYMTCRLWQRRGITGDATYGEAITEGGEAITEGGEAITN